MAIAISYVKLLEVVSGRRPSGDRSELPRGQTFCGVEFDSREIKGGELFIALKGENAHGHDFLDEAFRRGAALALVEDDQAALRQAEPQRCVVVGDTLAAFHTLANWWRMQTGLPVLAITGSVGKTTVKEMCAAILMLSGPGVYSLKSHNNHVGVPYTICRISPQHIWAVLEMGMNHKGEISVLSGIAAPDVAAVTLIAPAHIENFEGLEGIADAKFEIANGMRENSVLIVRDDDPQQGQAIERLSLLQRHQIKRFGSYNDSDAVVTGARSRGLEGISFNLRMGSSEKVINMSVLGLQNAYNAACAALAAQALLPWLTFEQIAQGLENFRAPLMRMNIKELRGGRIIIDDSYNSNPASLRACLELAGDLCAEGRRVGLLLGDMRELGSRSEEFHRELGSYAASLRPVFVYGVGDSIGALLAAASLGGINTKQFNSPEQAAEEIPLESCDVLLVKGSRAVGLDRAVRILEDQKG